MSNDDRRRAKRYALWFPLEVASEPGEWRLVVTRNISTTGALMVSVIDWSVGSNVTVRMQPPGETDVRELHGTIVRAEENDESHDGLWSHRVALRFDAEVPELEAILERVTESARPP
jgi:PilZ domain-containing protein